MATSRTDDLERIAKALAAAAAIFPEPGTVRAERKAGGDPVTEIDRRADAILRESLLRPGEGWLSEETADSPDRLGRSRVWIVDPIDGTREFVDGIPEFSISVGLVEQGVPVAGGICNPATGETYLGATGHGLTLNGTPARVSGRTELRGASVLVSRSEARRGEWDRYRDLALEILPLGSVAYKLARVAAGQADTSCTLNPRHEWDVAGGAALVLAGGGAVMLPDESTPAFNRRTPKFQGFLAGPAGLLTALRRSF